MTIVLGTHSTNPEFNGDCDYAVVQLTPWVMDQIRQRVELARQAGHQDNDLYELYFWGGRAEFYGCELVEACQEAVGADQAAQDWLTGLEQNGHALMPPTVNLATCEIQRIECAGDCPAQSLVRQPAVRDRLDCEPEAFGCVRHHGRSAGDGPGRLPPQRRHAVIG